MADIFTTLLPNETITAGMTVRVAAEYLADQSSPEAGRWFWSYHVRIENHREGAVQLLARHWVIQDAREKVHEVRGLGVVGETPLIEPGGAYDYVSGCPLDTSSGSMRGKFHMIDDEGTTFDISIPAFELVAPDD